jgi:outer membrane protein TolC
MLVRVMARSSIAASSLLASVAGAARTHACLTGALLLTGCAVYAPKPLDYAPSLPDRISAIVVDPVTLPLPELRRHTFDPSDGLDMTEVAMLAVVNNPDLVLARDDAGIARAQAFAAGLLPDPQLSFGRDFPFTGVYTSSAFALGLSYAINALITYSTSKAAAEADLDKAHLSVLWQEWQVVARARVLFAKITQADAVMKVLVENRTLFADRYRRTHQALDEGLTTLDAVTPHLTAVQDVQRQINDLERQLNQSRHDLNALLGLSPDLVLPLVGNAQLPPIDESRLAAALPQLLRNRPDLRALEAGYAAQDARYRAAILGQFPALTVGGTRLRDTSDVNQRGFSVTLNLPIFSGGRGEVAIAVATRQRLYDEYRQRVTTTEGEIRRILDEERIDFAQLREIDQGLAALEQAAAQARAAFTARAIDALAFAGVESSLLAKRVEKLNLEESILEQQVGLRALVGSVLPEQTDTGPEWR